MSVIETSSDKKLFKASFRGQKKKTSTDNMRSPSLKLAMEPRWVKKKQARDFY